ncbi:MAG: hypothetical protein R3B48_11385 [Kofleriaceae bacterium]
MTWNLPHDLTPWAHHLEATYIALTLGRPPPPPLVSAELEARALDAVVAAAACAVAARFLAVGKPRSLGVVSDDPQRAAALFAGHRVWHQPTDVRWAGRAAADPAILAAGGRAVSLEEAVTADIVCLDVRAELRNAAVRRGSHINLLDGTADDELRARAECYAEVATAGHTATLGELAAGIRDGRQLDEITLLLAVRDAGAGADGLAIARRALGAACLAP